MRVARHAHTEGNPDIEEQNPRFGPGEGHSSSYDELETAGWKKVEYLDANS